MIGIVINVCCIVSYERKMRVANINTVLSSSSFTNLCEKWLARTTSQTSFQIYAGNTNSRYTVDRENFAVKIISRSRPTAKIKHAKNKLRVDDQ